MERGGSDVVVWVGGGGREWQEGEDSGGRWREGVAGRQ